MPKYAMLLVSLIAPIPQNLLVTLQHESARMNYERLSGMNGRSMTSVFKTSQTISLRAHDAPAGLTMREYSDISECKDTLLRCRFPAANRVVQWIYDRVKGDHLGRIMLVKLLANGEVPVHRDEGKYFDKHARYHVPLVSSPEVLFMCDTPETGKMEVGSLYRLRNLEPHGVLNAGATDRVHLIVDIQTGECQ